MCVPCSEAPVSRGVPRGPGVFSSAVDTMVVPAKRLKCLMAAAEAARLHRADDMLLHREPRVATCAMFVDAYKDVCGFMMLIAAWFMLPLTLRAKSARGSSGDQAAKRWNEACHRRWPCREP